jgi:capsular exopolysaccharide synthesis family protein
MDAMNPSKQESTQEDQQRGLERAAGVLAGMEVRQLLGIVTRQYKTIALIFLLVMGSAFLTLGLLEDRYSASAMLVVDESESQLVGMDALFSAGATLNNRVDTEVEVLKSSSVALRAIEKLKLWSDEEFGMLASLGDKIRLFFGGTNGHENLGAATIEELTDDQRAELVDKLSDGLKVSRRGLTSVISIDATSLSASKAARIANAIAESYFDVQIEARAKSAQRAADFLRARVNELAGAIREDNQRIDQFILEHSEEIGTPQARAELARLREEMAKVLGEQSAKAAQLAKLEQFLKDMNPTHLADTGIATELQRLANERSEFLNPATVKSGITDPRQSEEMTARLRELAGKEIDLRSKELSTFDNHAATVGQKVRDLISQQTLPQSMTVDLYRLQRDAETNRKLYDSYVARLGEVQQKISLALPNSRIMAPAIVPHEPSFPPTGIILALAGLTAIAFGAGAALLREHIIGGFASAEQLEAVSGLPVAGVVPHYSEPNPQDAILSSPFSQFSESIRRLRIAAENTINGKHPSVILVTSTEPNEGKTTLAIAVARAMAKSGRRTLLIDCDLRHSSVGRLMEATSPVKLVDLLLSVPTQDSFNKALGYEKDSDLYIINSESTKRFASDVLLASPQFRKILEFARTYFEAIVIDSPPIGYVVDANVISRECDLVLYVVRHAATSQRQVIGGLREILSGPKAPLVTMALNGAKELLGSHYYRSNKYENYYS